MSNIHGLSSTSKKDDKKDNEEFFGGGATSGTATWRPTNGPMRQQPQTNNTSSAGPPVSGTPSPADLMRDITSAARSQSASSSNEGIDRSIGLITLYSNGFILGNAEFRDAKDPRNASFLASLREGEVPSELEADCRREWGADADAVRVTLVDKSSEAFVPPKAKFNFAASKGQALTISSSSTSSTHYTAFSSILPRRVTIDSTLPTTQLQLVLIDRSKTRETFNAESTVGDVFAHVASLPSSSGARPIELTAGFPPKPLTDPNVTLKNAGLLGASLTARVIKLQ